MKTASTQFNDAFNLDDAVYATHRLMCEFGSNRFNDGQVVTASSTKKATKGVNKVQVEPINFWREEDAFNDKNYNTMKWAVCDSGTKAYADADGTGYRAFSFDVNEELEHGWWSDTVSNLSGVFTTPQWVQSTFDSRLVNNVTLYLTDCYDNMKQVTVEYKDTSGAWIPVFSNRTLAANEYEVSVDIPQTSVTGLRATVHSTYRPKDRARISELNAYYRVDISDDLISMDVRDSREEYEDSTVPIGTHRANTLDFELDNTQGLYNPDGDSPYAPYIGSGIRVKPYIGVDLNKGQGAPNYEYVQMGEYWTDDFSVDGGGATASVSCRDFSKFMQDEDEEYGYLWENTNLAKIMRDVMARMGIHESRVDVDDRFLRGFAQVYIKDESYWDFMNEVSFADQGTFGFDHEGNFFFHSYDRLDFAPYNNSQMTLAWDRNIVSGSLRTKIYINKAVVKSNNFEKLENKKQGIWAPPDDDVLRWSKVKSNITTTSTTIPVALAPNQKAPLDLTSEWYEEGVLFLPLFSKDYYSLYESDKHEFLIGGELIKYSGRTATAFTGCIRGYLGTTPQAWPSGQYIGEARYYEMDWDKSPATNIKYFTTAIDVLKNFAEERFPQAVVPIFEVDAFKGKMCIANLVNYYTWLQGDGISFKDFESSDFDNLFQWSTAVAGMVLTEKTGTESVSGDVDPGVEKENRDLIRRYGLNKIEIDNPWIQNKSHARSIVKVLIDEYKKPRDVIDLQIFGNPTLSTGDRVTITNYPQLDIQNKDYHVVDISYSYDGGLRASISIREVKEDD